MSLAPILLTLGDPLGIGPEIVARAHLMGELHDAVVVGSPAVLRRAFEGLSTPLGAGVIAVLDAPDEPAPAGTLRVWPGEPANAGIQGVLHDELAQLPWGQVDARAGAAAAHWISTAARAVMAGQGRALVTAPIHKAALSAAGIDYPGHTEMLQALAAEPGQHAPPVRMMLANDQLKVVLVTIHMSLRQAIDTLSTELVLETLRIAHAACTSGLAGASASAGSKPRIAVAGLNPHAGEGGLFGDEELSIIAPAIAQARAEGIDAQGPFAPDTVFMRARNAPDHPGEFDLVVAMTHDHGLIPVKYMGVEQGVNVTLGLPFVRTSPDHGTAFDIAGQGRADASSLLAALRWARQSQHLSNIA